MTRPAVVVREATADDTPALLAMWSELRDMGGRIERLMPGPDAEGLRERLAWVATDPSSRALVAVVDDDEVAGMTLLTESPYAPLFEQRAVHAHYLHVRDGFRRRGVGKALLAAAVAFAEEVGAEHVMTSVLPQMRETQRFYARLGLQPGRRPAVGTGQRAASPARAVGRHVGDGQPAGPASLAAPGPRRGRRPRRRLTCSASGSRRDVAQQAGDARRAHRPAGLVDDLDLPGRDRRAEVQRSRGAR